VSLQALIFDVDGTLYEQGALRRRMLRLWLARYWRQPRLGFSTLQILQAYRRAQETLRHRAPEGVDLATAQLELAAARSGASRESIGAVVETWMESEPLALLAGCARPGLRRLLEEARAAGLRLAAVSDYPAGKKLEALGVAPYFECVLSAQDGEVQRFKPHPRGLEAAAARLGVECRRSAYIGDRPLVDTAAARAAGMRSMIVRGGQSFPSVAELEMNS
jgi:beta-phosphoglucomutase-like phosphatase (HAD superfamily)